MSETITLENVNVEEDIKTSQDDETNAPSSTLNTTTPACQAEADEDLEDGEIDDDDEDADDSVIIVGQQKSAVVSGVGNEENPPKNESPAKMLPDNVITIDLSHDSAPTKTPTPSPPMKKSKKSLPIHDDHASSIENAIANVLKKKGIEPTMPRLSESRQSQQDSDIMPGQGKSRSSRRRKRKKQRDEKEKEKERKDKKKLRYETSETGDIGAPPLDDEDDLDDDYEMLNVRGGSPPPMTGPPQTSHLLLTSFKDQFDSADDSYSSYDSYDSGGEGGGGGTVVDGGNRRRKRGKKASKRRDRSGRNRNDEERNGRQEKRKRRDSEDEKHRQEPRKMELCKFYLLECCAKKDKCSYMHSDFPCKYYYLGMDCAYKDACKFGHGEPLTEQLRNILLKHLETAPKEILGNFKRISRENAIGLITKRHEELCKEMNVENTWSSGVPMLNINQNRRGGGGGGGDHNQQQYQQQQKHMQHYQQQQQQQQQQQNQTTNNIPSLLKLVISPPMSMNTLNATNALKNDKQRRSRWTDTSGAKSGGGGGSSGGVEQAASSAPAYLDLKNFTGVLSAEHIEKLSHLGITNLEQVNQLTFGQLNEIGLTIAQISEIQLNAINMSKLCTPASGTSAASMTADESKITTDNGPTNRDVDMRFLPSAAATSKSTPNNSQDVLSGNQDPDKDATACSNSNSNSSGGVVMVDYSQYLKDSNLSFDRSDIYDDEKDEEQLVIDDGNTDNEDLHSSTVTSTTLDNKEKKSDKVDIEPMHALFYADSISNALKNPFSSTFAAEQKKETRHRDPRAYLRSASTEQQKHINPFKANAYQAQAQDENNDGRHAGDDYERFYSTRTRRSHSRSRSRSRSRSHTPTRSQSSTPEASQSSEQDESLPPKYERATMYDFSARVAEEDEARRCSSIKADKDMRFLQGGSDIDLRLPFQPVMNYTPATEIDGSITSHLPMTYKVYEVEVANPNYMELRQNFKSDHTSDPRLRRILGLPELSQTRTSAALSRGVRKLSNNIASPESEDASPKYYTPPSSFSTAHNEERVPKSAKSSSGSGLRLDPRRAKTNSKSASHVTTDSIGSAAGTGIGAGSSSPAATSSSQHGSSSGAMKQNVEIRNLLQKSEWYKELNSKFKIMVNQQLALVSTELKKFHQDASPNKIFDISFIVNNATLQQILTNLGIFIDDNGEVSHVDADNEDGSCSSASNNSGSAGINLPNLSQPPPPAQMDFLRAPPPNMAPHIFRPGMVGPPPVMSLPPFAQPPPNARPSLLGLPPGNSSFNPFAGNMPADLAVMNANFVGGPGLMGPGPVGAFGPAGILANMQQRNFNNQRNQQQRNQSYRRNNKI